MRFNPPPGWPIPPGWSPPQDWTPDPEWPAAPPDWQFWIDDTTPSTTDIEVPPRGFRRTAVLAVIVVLLGAAAAGYAWWPRSAAPSSQESEYMLTGTYPVAPQPSWVFKIADHIPTAGAEFRSAAFNSDLSVDTGATVIDGHVVTYIVNAAGPGRGELVSLDVDNGKLQWSIPDGPSACARHPMGDTLPCIVSRNGRHSTVGFVNLGSGSIEATTTVDAAVHMIETDGQSLYTGSEDASAGFVVAKGTRDNPFANWKTVVSNADCATSHTFDRLSIDHQLVWGTLGGGAYAVLRTDSGSPLFDHPVTRVTVSEDGSRVAAPRCDGDTDSYELTTDVVDGAGTRLFSTDKTLWHPAMQVYQGGVPPYVTQEGDGLDSTTGEQLWHSDLPPDGKGGGRSLVGNTLIGGTADGLEAVDARSGRRLWSWVRPTGLNGFSRLTDGSHLFLSNENGGIDAVSLADGAETWSTTGVSGQPPRLLASREGIVTVTDTAIQLLRPTGPASDIPSGLDRGTGSGADLVTACGRRPELRPEAVRTDSGALVIRMRIVAHCPGGDVLSGSQTRISVSANGENFASGVFDLSSEPIVIPPNSTGDNSNPMVEHEFRFPAGTYRAGIGTGSTTPDSPPQDVGGIDPATLVVACDQGGVTRASASPGTGASSHTAGAPAGLTFDTMRSFVETYYGELPINIEDAWSKLDPHLANQNGHQDYVDFWSSIESVSILSVGPRGADSVVARLVYRHRDGRTQTEDRWLSFVGEGAAMRIYDSAVTG